MGLDSYWVRPDEQLVNTSVTFDPPLRLCGGLLSEHGQSSFRGKVYNDVIKKVTGQSLYQEEIPNQVVREMATKLRAYREGFVMSPDTTVADLMARQAAQDSDVSVRELDDLVRMFEAYGKAGCILHGWW